MVPNPKADALALDIKAALDVEPIPDPSASKFIRWVHPISFESHRLDGPALRMADEPDYESWYINGIRHRIDGPALVRPTHRAWWVNGVLHRLDGPAWDDPKSPEWYVNGFPVDDSDAVLKYLRDSGELGQLEAVLRLWRPDGPQLTELAAAVAAAHS